MPGPSRATILCADQSAADLAGCRRTQGRAADGGVAAAGAIFTLSTTIAATANADHAG